jgi:hypothetical protein
LAKADEWLRGYERLARLQELLRHPDNEGGIR